jgi:hypothetical protein
LESIYKIDELCGLSDVADIHKLSLKLLQDYYKIHLMPYNYKFELPGEKTINLSFPKAQFCHLLAIEKIMTLQSKNKKNAKNYKGLRGYESIENLTITFDTLKKGPHRSFFIRNENKFVHFHLLHKLIERPTIINYDSSIVTPSTRIEADFVFYDVVSGSYIHLGVVKQNNSLNQYVPRSLFVESKGSKHVDKFVKGQALVNFEKKHKTEIIVPN